MRETCARVLAAALMTGAIAIVVGMAAHLGTANRPDPAIAVPPSALQRTVRLTARPAPAPRATTARLVTTHTTGNQARPETVRRSLVVVRRHRSKRPASRELASTTTVPAPTPAPAPAPAPAVADPAPSAAPTPADQGDQGGGPDRGHGHGHAYGRGKQDD